MKSAVIVFPGSNCDRDAAVCLRAASGRAPQMVWHTQATVPDVDLIVLPGGFSHGDYLRPGGMAAHAPVMGDVIAKARRGVPVLGICNGFQILTEAGLLPGALMRNAGLAFICQRVHLRVERAAAPFTHGYRQGQVAAMIAAHHDGNYVADAQTLARLEGEGRIALRYCTAQGRVTAGANPNGAAGNIAGIVNAAGNVLGLMPHPERAADEALGGADGRAMFTGLAGALS